MPNLRIGLREAERLDVEATLRLEEWRDNPLVKALAGLAQIADQTPAVSAGTLMLALALLRRDARLGLICGDRMAAVIESEAAIVPRASHASDTHRQSFRLAAPLISSPPNRRPR